MKPSLYSNYSKAVKTFILTSFPSSLVVFASNERCRPFYFHNYVGFRIVIKADSPWSCVPVCVRMYTWTCVLFVSVCMCLFFIWLEVTRSTWLILSNSEHSTQTCFISNWGTRVASVIFWKLKIRIFIILRHGYFIPHKMNMLLNIIKYFGSYEKQPSFVSWVSW